ncbi:hypothetical protein JJJ17_16370 [Paracoccus caeni]|uniref:HTH luxR-type domain-containing protein n=1 Tax=Paracoccus caeni TaxID=657651 RepID=A0A934SEP6_9RHOB|nr:hypothetical protein [Paracoccus caeni]MBK4217506.1 hypothetical protein [Paracoccus caeni]
MSTDSDILRMLIRASAGEEDGHGSDLWPAVLDLLARATRAASVRLQVLRSGRLAFDWQSRAEMVDAGLRLAAMPSPDIIALIRSERVYAATDLPGAKGTADPLRILRVTLGRDEIAVLALMRGGEDFRAMDGLRLSNLAPYLGPALSAWQKLAAERRRARLDRQIGKRLGTGWILFAPSGQVTDMADGLAETLAADFGVRRRADGWLDLPVPTGGTTLHRAFSALEGDGAAQRVILSREPLLQMLLAPEDIGDERHVIGRVRMSLQARSLPVASVADSFGLSRGEARLAMLLCDGFSLQQAAAELGWTIETARSYSKQLYARMGVSGQTGVIRRMMDSAVWLG